MSQTARLTLIGVVHHDPDGEERLLALLRRLAPDRITVEVSPAAIDYRLTHGRLLLLSLDRILERICEGSALSRQELDRHPAVASLRTLLALPFEYRAARRCTAPCDLIDSSEISLLKLRRIERELITYRNLKTLLQRPPEETAPRNEGYAAARAMFAGAPPALRETFLAGCRGSEGVGPRDRRLAQEIRGRLVAGGHLVHIGGWVHLIEDPRSETLYSLLADLAPERLLLEPPPAG